jgi:hypothetical protein
VRRADQVRASLYTRIQRSGLKWPLASSRKCALVADHEVVAPLLDDDEWEKLRADVRAKTVALTLPCCAASAFPRVSKLGTRHFVHHRANGCEGAGETFQHLWAKAETLAACSEAGWNARTEVAGDGWRADVLASRGDARLAFEVQWSAQELEAFESRQQRYLSNGIRGTWLFRGEIANPGRRELPIFALRADPDLVAVVELGGQTFRLREFVALLLAGGVQFRPTLRARLRVSFVDMDCWRCKRPAHIYYAQQWSRCGHTLGHAFPAEPNATVDEFDPQVRAFVQRWLAGEGRDAGIMLGAIRSRHSRTLETSYLSFGCPHCDALFGDFFVRGEVLEAAVEDYAVARFEAEAPAIGLDGLQGHWCLPAAGRSYCGAEALSAAA